MAIFIAVIRVEWLLLSVLPVLINVAFLVLIERKLLSFRQTRVGPIKVGAYGLLQSFRDVVKLLANRSTFLAATTPSLYISAPLIALILAIFLTLTLPQSGGQGV